MKRTLFLFIVLIIFHNSVFGQNSINVYQDAVDYTKGKLTFDDLNKKYGSLQGNNYFKDENESKGVEIQKMLLETTGSKAFYQGTFSKSIAKGEINPVVDGISSFLVSRAKKELSISFFNGFKAQITNEKYIDYRMLFANTYAELKLVDEKIYDFQPYIQTLQKKFKSDIDTLATTFNAVIKADNTKMGQFLTKEKNEKTKISLYALTDLISGIQKGENVGAVLETMHYDVKSTNSKGASLRNNLDLFRLLSFALRVDNNSNEYYISKNQIESLLKDNGLLRVFLGLTAAVVKNPSKDVKFDLSAYDVLNKKANKISDFRNILTSYQEAAEMLRDNGKSESDKLNNYFKGCSKLLGTLALLKNISSNNEEEEKEISSMVLTLVKGSEMIFSIKSREYTRAVNLFSSIVLSTNFIGKSAKIARFIGKYGVFMAQIADSENSEQVQEALEYFAAPVGSWRDKSRDKFSMAIDSYVGLGGRFNSEKARTYVATPIGLSFNFSPFKNNIWGVSFFTSFIDLGAVTSFRFKNDSTALAPIYLKQIVAPGAFLSIHHGKVPMFLNLGYQKNSILSDVNSNGSLNLINSNWRFSVSLNVNIPITYIIKR